MDFSPTEEQQLLQDSTRRLLQAIYSFEARAERLASGRPSQTVWAQLAEHGLLSIEVPEPLGGLGADAFTMMGVCQAMGEALCVEPFVDSALIASRAIARIGNDEQRQRWLPQMAAGELIATLAHLPIDAAWPVVEPGSSGLCMHGRVHGLEFADCAALLLIPARDSQGQRGLYALSAQASGLSLRAQPTVDGRSSCSLELRSTPVERLSTNCAVELDALRDYGLAAHCADALGTLERGLSSTIDYVRTRQQFGQPIGRFQALQHRLADLYMRVEEARSMALLAAARCAGEDAAERTRALSAAKWVIGRAARELGQQAVQLHGGMGMSDELDISHVFKRLLAFELRFGSSAQHLQRRAAELAA
jgi:alkylation response protein AidB-like acyl-CoA dehydrogenase